MSYFSEEIARIRSQFQGDSTILEEIISDTEELFQSQYECEGMVLGHDGFEFTDDTYDLAKQSIAADMGISEVTYDPETGEYDFSELLDRLDRELIRRVKAAAFN